MTVKVVTDSGSDISPELAKELEITIVPLYVIFGEESFKDGIEITPDQFYERLIRDPVHPTTSQPSPRDFLEVYERLSQETDQIISIHIGQKLSQTFETANLAKKMLQEKKRCQIEIIDSQGGAMHLGFLAMFAARLAKAGEKLDEIIRKTKEIIPKIHLLGLLDTLEYLRRGGRIGKAAALLGSLLNVKPLLTIKDGEVFPAGRARGIHQATERLFDFIKGFLEKGIKEIAVEYSTGLEKAEELIARINSLSLPIKPYLLRIGPMIGVHAGPGALIVTLREG
jgi:DegV family protein with EDD domain